MKEKPKVTFSRRLRRNAKAGWRKVGKQRVYFRSKMEANYAGYLELMRKTGKIVSWEHEKETFWFSGIRRGCVSYLPDFRIVDVDGDKYYAEVKGFWDKKSLTKMKRMKKYFPDVCIDIIEKKQMDVIKSEYSHLIPTWEV